MKNKTMSKENQYAMKIQSQILSMFDEDSENYINKNDFDNDDNSTAFMHALANIVPATLYNKMTGNEHNILEFNHIANTLVVNFINKK